MKFFFAYISDDSSYEIKFLKKNLAYFFFVNFFFLEYYEIYADEIRAKYNFNLFFLSKKSQIQCLKLKNQMGCLKEENHDFLKTINMYE